MVEFHQLVQEIAWVQESVMPMPTPTPTRLPTPTESALKPICPPHINSEKCNPELRFLLSAHRLLLNICVKFHENISNGF